MCTRSGKLLFQLCWSQHRASVSLDQGHRPGTHRFPHGYALYTAASSRSADLSVTIWIDAGKTVTFNSFIPLKVPFNGMKPWAGPGLWWWLGGDSWQMFHYNQFKYIGYTGTLPPVWHVTFIMTMSGFPESFVKCCFLVQNRRLLRPHPVSVHWC